MKGRVINTKDMVEVVKVEIKKEVEELRAELYIPRLTIIQVGNDKASSSYVKSKIRVGEELGVEVHHIVLPEDITEEKLINEVTCYGRGPSDGLIVQLPLPKHINERRILDSIPPDKDVDGLGSVQIGRLNAGLPGAFEPCTALGVTMMLTELTDIKGKDVVIINRSHLIGQPLQKILTDLDATVTLCHSKTKDLKDKVLNADIVITGIGKVGYFNNNCFKDGQIIIDCSMNMNDEGKLCGDVRRDEVLEFLDVDIASGPGHTGIFTTTCLMLNTVRSALMTIYRYGPGRVSSVDKIGDVK